MTLAVKLTVPAAVGVPEIAPVAGSSVSPAGSAPVIEYASGGLLAVAASASVTLTVNGAAPGADGVPESAPAAESGRPAGNGPDAIDHASVALPPAAAKVALYASPVYPSASGEAV